MIQWLGLSSHCQGSGSIPGQGIKIPQAVWSKKKKKRGKSAPTCPHKSIPRGCCYLVAKLCLTSFATPQTVTHQVPLSMVFSKQVYWSGLPFSSPGDIPDPGIKPVSPALWVDSLPLSYQTVLPTSRLFLYLTVGGTLLFPVS